MKKILNHRLYNKYFPIKNELEKQIFLDNEKYNLQKFLRSMQLNHEVQLMVLYEEYAKKMKNTVSVFGNIKYGNILYNKQIELEMKHDPFFLRIKKEMNEIDILSDEILFKNNMSIDVINQLLDLINKTKQREIFFCLWRLGAVVALLLIILLIVQ